MKSNRYLFTFILILVLTALACSLPGGDDPTPEPEATATSAPEEAPAPTEAPTDVPEPTAAPTETPAPTATPDVTAGFITYYSDTAGVTVDYPESWFVDDIFFLTIASSEVLLEETTGQEEGGLLLIITEDIGEFEGNDATEILTSAMADFELDEGMEITGEPQTTQIQGQDAAQITLSGPADDGTMLEAKITSILNGDRVAIVMAATPVDSAAEYQPTLDAITNTIVLSEPTAEDPFGDSSFGGETSAGELILLALGDSLDADIPENTYQDFSFQGQADETVSVIVETDDDMDLVLAIYEAGELDSALVEVDDGFSGESEAIVFTAADDGEYIVRVRGFAGGGGSFTISLEEGSQLIPPVADAVPIAPGTSDSGPLEEDLTFVFEGEADTLAAIILAPLDDELDLTATVLDANGNELLYIDDGFSGEYEVVLFVPETSGDYYLTVSSWSGSEGDLSLVMIDPDQTTALDGVVSGDDPTNYRFCAPPGEALIFIVIPEEDFDVVFELLGAGGGLLSDEIDNGFSGEPEVIFFDDLSSETEAYPIIVSVRGFGSNGGEFGLFATTDGSMELVLDGC